MVVAFFESVTVGILEKSISVGVFKTSAAFTFIFMLAVLLFSMVNGFSNFKETVLMQFDGCLYPPI